MNKPPEGEKYRILVIDDNHAIHDDFHKIFSPVSAATEALEAAEAALFGTAGSASPQSWFKMDTVDQGQEGRRRVQKALEEGRPYALAFVDMRMPLGWDGMETTRKIWEVDPAVQIVICTAYSDYSWSEMLEKIGGNKGLVVLKKPFDTIEVLQLAHALTEKWRLHRQFLQDVGDLERKLAERTRELSEAEAAAQAAVRAQVDVLGEVGRKIRASADNVAGMSGLLLGTELDPAQRGFAKTISASAEQLSKLAAELLDSPETGPGKKGI